MSKFVRISITNDKDLILSFDFDKKIIEVESDYWTTIAKRKGIESPDAVATIPTTKKQVETNIDASDVVKPNKKIQASKEERTLEKVMQIFDSIAEDKLNVYNVVPARALRLTLESKKIVSSYQEFTRYLNMALETNLIEVTSDDSELKGYKRKK